MPYAKMARISNFHQLAAQRMNGRPAQRNDHCRADTPDFRIEPDAACVDVFLRRRFVNAAFAAGLPAEMLDDGGKEDFFDREPRLGDRGSEQRARGSNERPSRQVFFIARLLPAAPHRRRPPPPSRYTPGGAAL